MSPSGVSVIVCCHNGARRLSETIRHIAAQRLPADVQWECILVDNASTDGSGDVAECIWHQSGAAAPLRIIGEPALGLSHARARGFAEARYAYIVLCDDDNWLAPDYAARAYSTMEGHPKIGVLGGFGVLQLEVIPPAAVRGLEVVFASGKQAARSGPVDTHRVYGAGCIVRKSAYEKLLMSGFRNLLIDRHGNALSSGGDHELCYALAVLGFEIWYDEAMVFVHFITRERLSVEYFRRYARESAIGFDLLLSYKAIAAGKAGYRSALWVIAREFVYYVRQCATVGLEAITTHPGTPTHRMAMFRFAIMGRKVLAFPLVWRSILKNHRVILSLRDRSLGDAKGTMQTGEPVVTRVSASTL